MDSHELHTKIGTSLLDQIAADPELINRPAPGVTPIVKSTEPEPVVLLHPDEHLPAPVPAKGHKFVLLAVVAGAFLTLSGGGAAAYFALRPAATVIVPALASPKPTMATTASPAATIQTTPTATASPSPLPSPTDAPTPTPSLTLGASTVKAVTVTYKTGLNLRSTPDSSSRSNIVTWVPRGAVLDVDQTGGYWWHGSYKGQPGYFAASYTH